jgi:hypothetical protein
MAGRTAEATRRCILIGSILLVCIEMPAPPQVAVAADHGKTEAPNNSLCLPTLDPIIELKPASQWQYSERAVLRASWSEKACDTMKTVGYEVTVAVPTVMEVRALGTEDNLQVVFQGRQGDNGYQTFKQLSGGLRALDPDEVHALEKAHPGELERKTLRVSLGPGTYRIAVLFQRFNVYNRSAWTRLQYRQVDRTAFFCDNVNNLGQYNGGHILCWGYCRTKNKLKAAKARCKLLEAKRICYWDEMGARPRCKVIPHNPVVPNPPSPPQVQPPDRRGPGSRQGQGG